MFVGILCISVNEWYYDSTEEDVLIYETVKLKCLAT